LSVFLAFLIAFLLSCTQRDSIPPLKLQTLEGKELYLRDLKGKKVVIKERKDLYVISYAVAMEKEDVLKSYKDLGISPNFRTVLDPEVKFNEYYRIVFLPSTFVFDERGRFINSYPGFPKDILSSLKSSSSNSFLFSSKLSSGLTSIGLPIKRRPFVKG